jgi:uncharacterized membrane protein HdeD (DUF308 family)
MNAPNNATPLLNGATATTGFAFTASFVETDEEIASHWKLILFLGIINVMAGIACLFAPIIATQVVEIFLISLVFVSGCFNMCALCFNDRGHRHQFFWMGLIQVLIATLMYTHPFGTLAVLTFFIAFIFMLFGSFQTALAWHNPRMAARGATFFSGIMTLILSILILLSMPMSAWITIGVLIGANLVNVGLTRIGVACYGRSLSGQVTLMPHDSWKRSMDFGFA